jgi:4-hydroxy-tetrahydrodipicolinate reductase
MTIRVMHVGLGPIGAAIARQIAARATLRSVGAVDIDSSKIGRDLGDVLGLGRKLRVAVSADISRTIKATRPDIVVLCTTSSLRSVVPQIESILKHKVPIVSTTEELCYPVAANRRWARRIDAAAHAAKVAVHATGVNPGFAMDALPIMLTAVCERVDSVRVDRVQDARMRRLPFQQKIGVGLSEPQFQTKVRLGTVRHVGLAESVRMIADAVGWRLDRVTDDLHPRIADTTVEGDALTVKPGEVCGIVQDGVGYVKGLPCITLHMEAYFGAAEPYDAITIEGSPRLHSKIDGGLHGDIATASIVVNSIPRVLEAAPGLRTMRDMPLPSFLGR